MRGENSPTWIEDRTMIKDSNHSFRERVELKEWRKQVFERDNYTCQMCHNRTSKGNQVILNAHHIKRVKDYPLLAFIVSNGITLCKDCHFKTLGREEEYEVVFKNILMIKEKLKKEFDKRIKVLGKIEKGIKEELFWKFVNCYEKEGFKCYYCGNKMELKWGSEFSFTFDHYIPKSKSGLDSADNLVFCCRDCNFLKGNMPAEKYMNNMERLKLRKKNNEYWKARKSTKNDESMREAYKDIFEMRDAKTK